jgi:hypothetical protein
MQHKYTQTVSFRDVRLYQITQGIRRLKRGLLVYTVAVRSAFLTFEGKTLCHRAVSWLRINTVPSTFIKATWSLATRSLMFLWWTALLLQESIPEESIESWCGDWGRHAIDLLRPDHLPGYVTLNHCRKSPPHCPEALSCRNQNFGRTARGKSSSSPD